VYDNKSRYRRDNRTHWEYNNWGSVMIQFISNPLQSDQNYTIQKHVEYSITIHILSRHYSDSWASHYPLSPFGHPLICERVCRYIAVLWNNFWMKQWTLTGCGPPFGVISVLIMFLKCFSSQSYPVAIENTCSSTAAYLQC